MLDAALEAQTFMKDITLESLREDRKTTQAVIRSIEVIGEAAVNISKEFKEVHPDIPWKQIAGMRNWLIHAYFDKRDMLYMLNNYVTFKLSIMFKYYEKTETIYRHICFRCFF